MLIESTVEPQKIKIQYIKDHMVHIRLRKNIKQITKEENGRHIVMFEYDEVIFDIDNTDNLIKQIENNFDLYFNYGLQQMELNKSKEKAEKQIYNLINQHKLVDLNNNTESATMLLTLLMSEIDSLKNEIKFLKEKVGV
ncbi:hypothetical protein [Clostridium botulinum]|uniref:hypothetical protein n=1 Tax=Clostridium botulinum TaxID=1491 RepID=UPI0004652BFC|nr:hypothetical protein [Clostridium botulinum]APR02469.1 hypothetical protein RSJ2_4080 [Clostridium botulinum]AUN01593.1 hypothetical protein RSJ19_01035 [Clostridium botulinum]MBN3359314.1 hypothetical protein [Clostridium botulinum]MBN3367140.1 hypothetical protein [Clostridium botulinum]MBN3371773.1 hypothetical protein [Clostridium botulinum]